MADMIYELTERHNVSRNFGDVCSLTKLTSGVTLLNLNIGGSVSVFDEETLKHFADAISIVMNDQSIKVTVLALSNCSDVNIIEPYSNQTLPFSTQAEARSLAQRGHALIREISSLHCPVIAAINGACLGGVFEVALCADKRIATTENKTIFGLTGMKIGLSPGLGGTQRLPRLIGYKNAIDLIFNGEVLDVNKALEIGVLDQVSNSRSLIPEAIKIGKELVLRKFDRAVYQKDETTAEEKENGSREYRSIIRVYQRMARIRSRDFIAPSRALHAIKVGYEKGIEEGLKEEIEIFSELACSEVTRNLINYYSLKQKISKIALETTESLQTIAIIGCGFMGRGIADLANEMGIKVFMKGSNYKKTNDIVEQLNKKSSNKEGHLITAVAEFSEIAKAELVIETVSECIETKKKVISELGRVLGSRSVLASNTSSIPLTTLASFTQWPHRFIGIHFFSPIKRMSLIEVISTDTTSQETLSTAMAFVSQLHKVPISVKDSPGFVVNRILTRYITEALRMAITGTPLNWIEETAKKLGMPLGPFELIDELGWSLSMAVSECLVAYFGERLKLPEEVQRPIKLGYEGKQSNIGCYVWENKSSKLSYNLEFIKSLGCILSRTKASVKETKQIEVRLFYTMIDESARCLEEGVVKEAKEIDLAMITGCGFSPLKGGVLRHADKLGVKTIVQELEIYNDNKPQRKISKLLLDMQKCEGSFYMAH